jgi:DNA-binding CsgD family transcriptional regulator
LQVKSRRIAPIRVSSMLQSDFHSVLEATDRESFRASVVRVAERLGFSTVAATAVIEKGARTEFIAVGNIPTTFSEAFEDLNAGSRDPVMQHLRRQSVPILWNQATYAKAGAGELWEHQAAYGFRTGIAMALHLPDGNHFLLGVDRDQPLPSDDEELTRVVAHLQLFAVHAQDAAFRVLVPSDSRPETPKLTMRELEVLRWTMEGKTAWEVGTILGISERTAVMHLSNATHKLGCTTKHQAVVKALRLGLID